MMNLDTLATRIKGWGLEQGFQRIGIARAYLGDAEPRLREWLERGYHGEMHYMSRHGVRRARPAELIPGTVTVIIGRMDYFASPTEAPVTAPEAPKTAPNLMSHAISQLDDGKTAYIARYALGRDYHKVLRRRMQRLADRIEKEIGAFGYRVFSDTGPVMEKPLARNAGLGWIGKHTNLIDKDAGSWFFLGELLTDLPLPTDEPPDAPHAADHCGSCSACISVCPTQAIVAPYQLDARRCISYLTIEHPGSIDVALRPLMGNRIYGCDDCQLCCPWNKFATPTREPDFKPRHGLDDAQLVPLFEWSEAEFIAKTEGTAIWRIGYERWLRNLAVALGNALAKAEQPAAVRARIRAALAARAEHPSPLVREHVQWALTQHR